MDRAATLHSVRFCARSREGDGPAASRVEDPAALQSSTGERQKDSALKRASGNHENPGGPPTPASPAMSLQRLSLSGSRPPGTLGLGGDMWKRLSANAGGAGI